MDYRTALAQAAARLQRAQTLPVRPAPAVRPGTTAVADNKQETPAPPLPGPLPPGVDALVCDQAVFTSARGAGGEGYRVITASPGLRAEERAELTRRAPSHGALERDGDNAAGVIGFLMQSGRFAVGLCGHDGLEHTARGGQRVFTHLALLDPKQFDAYRSHALWVSRVVQPHSRALAAAEPPDASEPLLLPKPAADAFDPFHSPPRDSSPEVEVVAALLASALDERRAVVVGAAHGPAAVEWALICTPPPLRPGISFSTGLRYATTRQLFWTVLEEDAPEVARAIRGQPVDLVRPGEAGRAVHPALTAWVRFICGLAWQGKLADIDGLTRDLPRHPAPALFARRIEEYQRRVEEERKRKEEELKKTGARGAE